LNRSSRFRIYWKVFFAFFVFSFLWFTRHTILDSALVQPFYKTLNGNVTAQLIDSALIIVPIILLTLASGDKLPTIFLQRGNVRLGLIVGLIVFIVFFLVSGAVAVQFIGMSPGGFLFLTPYLLVLALVNGFKEELWFRGLFLNKYEPLLGFRLSNFLQAPIFAASLIEAEFASALIGIVLVSFVLGLGLGYLMRRTGSILGPSLCEAGSVIPIFLVALSSLKP
jgi:membrane protease YdiL (CAAX protease family)